MEVMTVGEYVSGDYKSGWNDDGSTFVAANLAWRIHGGDSHYSSGLTSGIWATGYAEGVGYWTIGFRAVQSGV